MPGNSLASVINWRPYLRGRACSGISEACGFYPGYPTATQRHPHTTQPRPVSSFVWERCLFSFRVNEEHGAPRRTIRLFASCAWLGKDTVRWHIIGTAPGLPASTVGSFLWLISTSSSRLRHSTIHSTPQRYLSKSPRYVQQHVSCEFRLTRSCPMGQSV